MWTVEVGFEPGVTDALGESVRREIEEELHLEVDSVRTIDVYQIRASLTKEQVEIVAQDLLTDPITQEFGIWNLELEGSFRGSLAFGRNFSHLIEVGYKPGVTDNVGRTTEEALEDLLGVKLKELESVHTSKLYLLKGTISDNDAKNICLSLLANPLIEYFQVWNKESWSKRGTEQNLYLEKEVKLRKEEPGKASNAKVAEINLDVDEQRLIEISKQGVLSLDLLEMRKIRDYFKDPHRIEQRRKVGLGAKPTDVELEMFAQTWSEHCKHKIFNSPIEYTTDEGTVLISGLFDTYIKKSTQEIATKKDWLVSVFVDNAGIISFNSDYNLVFKVETHNHPSALDPYGGAITGIVGVNRDPMGTGLGANLIFNTNVFCFGPPDFPYEKLPPGILHPKRIFKGVRKGVEHGGNKIGIPTVNGAILFDEAYVYNPLVYCGTGGIIPKRIAGKNSHEKIIVPGDLIVMVGGRIGKDGIHGATFSSTKLEEETSATAVQIGAPIVQKKMMDALQEARDQGLYRAITDNGAGGLSSSVGEMALLSGGCYVELDKAPTKYAGLDPWELWLSEAQERMTVAVPPSKIKSFLELCQQRDVEATVLGKFTNSGKVQVTYNGKTVLYLDLDFLHYGLPRSKKVAYWEEPTGNDAETLEETHKAPSSNNLSESLKKILSSLNVCSKEWVIRQYDHEVQGTSVLKPLVGVGNDGPSDAAVIRPLLDRPEGVIVACGINPKYGEIDTYWMAASAIDEALRNVMAVGGNLERIALLDNFCWGNPILSEENPKGDYKLAQLVRATQACYDFAVEFETPFISGKDSFHNEYQVGQKTVSIPPSLLISAIGVIKDCEKIISMDVKAPKDLVYVLGKTYDELGGSHYLMVENLNSKGGYVPRVRAKEAKRLYRALGKAIRRDLLSSCHDCSEGGLGVALAESAFAGGYGVEVDLRKVPAANLKREDKILFSESNSRFVATVPPNQKQEFEKMMAGNTFAEVGRVTLGKGFIIRGLEGQKVIEADIEELKETWRKPLRW